MQQMTIRTKAGSHLPYVSLAVGVFCLWGLLGCGSEDRVVFRSPSGRNRIEISRGGGFSSRIQVDLVSQNSRYQVFRSPNEAAWTFADVYWSADESLAGVVINGSVLFPLAFDVRKGRQIAFDTVRRAVEDNIRKDYRVPDGEQDVLRWTYDPDAGRQFYQKSLASRLK